MLSSRVPTRFVDCRVSNFDPTVSASTKKAVEAADEFLGGSITGLVLVGPPGSGKTHIAAAIVNEIVERNRQEHQAAVAAMTDTYPRIPLDPMWSNVADLIVQLRLDMDRPKDDRIAAAFASELRTHRALVVLDDLGREKVSDWTGETVYSIVNARYEERLPTIVTSNLTPDTLAASSYWTSISRIAEDGRLIAFRDTPDRRIRRA